MAEDRQPPRRQPPRRRSPQDAAGRRPREDGAAAAARGALRQVGELTGPGGGSVVGIERADGGWRVGVEVVELHRVPDSADVLATYLVELTADGEVAGLRRTRRYTRAQTDRASS